MNTSTIANVECLRIGGLLCLTGCPYFDHRQQNCAAAQHLLTPGEKYQASYCRSDDYDDCPLYLCQALRSSQSLGHDRESLRSSGK